METFLTESQQAETIDQLRTLCEAYKQQAAESEAKAQEYLEVIISAVDRSLPYEDESGVVRITLQDFAALVKLVPRR